MNIYQRINEVRKKIDYIRKEKAVQNYKAVTHDQVTAILRQHLIEFGIVVVPNICESVTIDTGEKTSKGTPIIRVEAVYEMYFVNMDDPDDNFGTTVSAHANDTGDKAPGKALSYAKKSIMLKVFEIESGDDEESRYQTEEAPMISQQQFDEFKSRIQSAGTKELAKVQWKIAVKACQEVNDVYSSAMLKTILLDHAGVLDKKAESVDVTTGEIQ